MMVQMQLIMEKTFITLPELKQHCYISYPLHNLKLTSLLESNDPKENRLWILVNTVRG